MQNILDEYVRTTGSIKVRLWKIAFVKEDYINYLQVSCLYHGFRLHLHREQKHIKHGNMQ